MKFNISHTRLLMAHKLMKGFVDCSAYRPILSAIHVICDFEKQQVTFESTNATKCIRWTIDTEVIEQGECSIILPKPLVYLLNDRKKSAIPINVTIYGKDGIFKADVDGNTIVLETRKETYPNLDSVYTNRLEDYENEPIVSIAQLEIALKSMREAGASTIQFSIPKKDYKPILMTCETFTHDVFVGVIATMRERF